jgi:hypothetical protein
LVEHSTENAGVVGSIPSPGTYGSLKPFRWLEASCFWLLMIKIVAVVAVVALVAVVAVV